MATRIDLDDLTGTTSGGLHLATMGGVWQALAFGFGGLRPLMGRLVIEPRLPPVWAALELRVRFHDTRVRIRIERHEVSIDADGPLALTVEGTNYDTDGAALSLRRRNHTREEFR
jgi:trehalose/maltose hydrolase-like predicted phosphorylase